MPSLPRRSLYLCATLLFAMSGCADQLKATPPHNVPRLAGNWELDAASSESLGTAVEAIQAQLHKLLRRGHHGPAAGNPVERRHREGGGFGIPGDNRPQEASNSIPTPQIPKVVVRAPQVGMKLIREFLANVPEGNYLALRIAPGVFTQLTGAGSEQCTPGVLTAVTLGEVAANETCGWRGRAFVVQIRPQYGPTLTEQYELAPNGELVLVLRLAGGGLDVRLTRRYRRTSQSPPIPLPTGD